MGTVREGQGVPRAHAAGEGVLKPLGYRAHRQPTAAHHPEDGLFLGGTKIQFGKDNTPCQAGLQPAFAGDASGGRELPIN